MSSGHRRFLLAALLAASIAHAACGDSGPPMEKVLETEHFVYFQEAGAPPPCPSVGEWLERNYRADEAFFGVTRTSASKISYRKYERLDAALSACRGAGRQCYLPESETVVTVEPVMQHEIAHAFETLVGTSERGPALFSEALATMIGGPAGTPRADRRVDTSLDVENLLGSDAFYQRTREKGPEATYPAAAALTRFLFDRYGKEAFLSFYGSLDGVTDGAEVEGRFMGRFGEALRDVIGEWRAAAPPPYDEVLASPVCGEVPRLDQATAMLVDPGCLYEAFRFDVPASGRLDLVMRRFPDQPVGSLPLLSLYRCDGGGLPLENGIFLTGDLRLALDLAPGEYMAIVSGAPVTLSVPAEPITLDADAACTPGRVAAELGGSDSLSLVVLRRWTTVEAHIALDLDIASAGTLSVTGVSDWLDAPWDVFACPQACLPSPDQQCAYDSLPGVQTMGEPRDVYGRGVVAGETLHFETGPRVRPDWQYSLRLSAFPPGP